MCLLSSTTKISIFHAVLQMLHHGQNCEFCHIEQCGKTKTNVTSLMNVQLTSFFFHTLSLYL